MNSLRPRRIEELFYHSDSADDSENENEDYKTAAFDDQQNNCNKTADNPGNKENQTPKHSCNEKNEYMTPVLIPRRPSELKILDVDFDEEESGHNRALLNDSFMLSPNSSIVSHESTSAKKCNTLQANFESLNINTAVAKIPLSTQKPQQKHATWLQTIQEDEANDIPKSNEQKPTAVTQTPNELALATRTAFNAASNKCAIQSDSQFVTPSVRSTALRQLPRNNGSTRSHKVREAFMNECRTQKVLFQTPVPIKRALPLEFNESLTISLCNTPVTTPDTIEKDLNVDKVIANNATLKSKRSLDVMFQNAEKQKNVVCSVPKAATVTTSSSASSLININNTVYEITKKLGCGGSSSVYLAHRKDTKKEFALKIVDLRGDPAIIEGYLNEAKLLQKLQGNVCVVKLFEFQLVKNESKLYMVMEKGDSDLNKILQSFSTHLPLYVLMNYLYQMLQAVNYIHQHGVIHSDLKPANFLMINGQLKLIDFGIASNISVDATSIIKFNQAGTFNYISPEALIDTSTGASPIRSNQPKMKISTKSDVWSLGCILYLLLYQKTPFNHIKNIYQKISAITSPQTQINFPPIPSYYPVMLKQMAESCLQRNPKSRPSCSDLLNLPFHMVIPIQNIPVLKKQ